MHVMDKVAVVSCHVERPLDDRCWSAFSALQAARPGGFEIAALMRPPAGGKSDSLWLARARIAYATAAATTRPQTRSCPRSSRPRSARTGAACPNAANATIAALATTAPRRTLRSGIASRPVSASAASTYRASGSSASTGSTSSTLTE